MSALGGNEVNIHSARYATSAAHVYCGLSTASGPAVIVDIAPIFEPYLEEALLRFSYLHPDVQLVKRQGLVEIESTDPAVAASFRHTLYRQKIYRETFTLRQSLIESLAE